MSGVRVRPYETGDRDAVRSICVATGMMGEPITPLFDAPETFADMFTGYYTDHEPEHCFVVEVDGAVAGYLVGTVDTAGAQTPADVLARHAVTRLLPLRPGAARFMWRGLFDSVFDWVRGSRAAHPDLSSHPAHTHINLLPQARLAPVAAGLYRSFFRAAKAKGCPGVHGEVYAENDAASGLHRAMGYRPEGAPSLVPAVRGLDGGRLHVQLWVRDL